MISGAFRLLMGSALGLAALTFGCASWAADANRAKPGAPLALPAAAAGAIGKVFPGSTVRKVQADDEAGLTLFLATVVDAGGERVVRLSADGMIVSVEREVKVADLPPALAAVVRQNTAGEVILQVETRAEIIADSKGAKTIRELWTPRPSYRNHREVDVDRDGRLWNARRRDAGEAIAPGEEGILEVPGYRPPCVIYLPSDYKAGAKWPLILHFHGSGDLATTKPWLWGINGKGYIIVGLSYVKGEGVTPANAAAMIKYVDAVRALVDATYGVDQHRVFLSGTSMGGWAVNYCGFSRAANGRYKGYCIVAAGPAKRSGVDFSVARNLPVLVLNGETDGNLAAAKQGVPLLERAGAKVTSVVLPGEGHMPQPPKIWQPLAKWLSSVDR
jgi:hypothetical protein